MFTNCYQIAVACFVADVVCESVVQLRIKERHNQKRCPLASLASWVRLTDRPSAGECVRVNKSN